MSPTALLILGIEGGTGLLLFLYLAVIIRAAREHDACTRSEENTLYLDAGANPIRCPSPLATDWSEIVDEKGEPPVVAERLP
jgi:hypothetical protein